MASGELAAANQAMEAARAQRQQGVSDIIGGVAQAGMSLATGGTSGLIMGALGQDVEANPNALLGRFFKEEE